MHLKPSLLNYHPFPLFIFFMFLFQNLWKYSRISPVILIRSKNIKYKRFSNSCGSFGMIWNPIDLYDLFCFYFYFWLSFFFFFHGFAIIFYLFPWKYRLFLFSFQSMKMLNFQFLWIFSGMIWNLIVSVVTWRPSWPKQNFLLIFWNLDWFFPAFSINLYILEKYGVFCFIFTLLKYFFFSLPSQFLEPAVRSMIKGKISDRCNIQYEYEVSPPTQKWRFLFHTWKRTTTQYCLTTSYTILTNRTKRWDNMQEK